MVPIAVVIDIVIVLALALFTWRGAAKGLILTLFGLLAVFVAWFGADLISTALTDPVAELIRPSIHSAVEQALEEKLGEILPDAGLSELPGASAQGAQAVAGLDPGHILEAMDRADLFPGLRGALEDAVREDAIRVTTTAADAVSAYLARLVAKAALFGVSFLLILLVWTLASRALDLAFQLPILDQVNTAGGAVLGLVKGVAIMLAAVWLARLSGLLTDANSGPIASLMTVEGLSGLLRSAVER